VKVIRLLFTIYIISLTVHPCADQGDELEKGDQVAYVSDHPHSDGEQEDVCTPFCICSCCAAHIRLVTISNEDFTCVLHYTKEVTPYLEKQVLPDYSHIWQPPRA